jgi:hypothetical protein
MPRVSDLFGDEEEVEYQRNEKEQEDLEALKAKWDSEDSEES